MSATTRKHAIRKLRTSAPLFAALGDETRLMLLMKLGDGSLLSIAQLTEGSRLTRQAITKHLRVLKEAGLVRGIRQGREALFELKRSPLDDASDALDLIAQQWDDALARLKAFVEKPSR